MSNDRWFKRFLVGVISLAVAVLLVALAVLGLLLSASNTRNQEAQDVLRRSTRAAQDLATANNQLLKELQGSLAARSEVVNDAIQRILTEFRVSLDCLHLQEQTGNWPPACHEVRDRVNFLARQQPPPTTTEKPTDPTPPSTPTTTTTPAPATTTPTSHSLPPPSRCRVGLLGFCIIS